MPFKSWKILSGFQDAGSKHLQIVINQLLTIYQGVHITYFNIIYIINSCHNAQQTLKLSSEPVP